MRRARTINQYTADGRLVATHKSCRMAAKAAGVSPTLICNCITGKQKMAGEFIYQYADQARGSQTCRPSDEPLKMYEKVRAYALSLCHCTDMADDLVQEAYTQYYEKFVEGNAYNFLTSVVKWYFYREVERHQQEADFDSLAYRLNQEEDEEIEEREKAKAAEHKAFMKKMNNVFATIKMEKRQKHTRQIFIWYLHGYSAAEIARKKHIKVVSAKQMIFQMRKHVCTYIGMPMREFTQYACH